MVSDVEDGSTRSTHEQPAELSDGAVGNDGVQREEDDVQFNDDEEVRSLTDGESEALAAVSQANVDPSTTSRQM